MFIFYLACLIFGGILMAFSLFFGGESDHSPEFHGELEMAGADPELSLDADHEIEVHHDAGDSHSNASEGAKFISFRNIIFFLTFFGLTGTVFHFINISEIITFLASTAMGGFAWSFGYMFMSYLKKSESGQAVNTYNLKGKIAKVTLPVGKGHKGKILVEASGNLHQLQAVLSEEATDEMITNNQKVLIIDIIDNTAICVKYEL